MIHDDAIERAARAIAKSQGDDFDQCPKDKSEWTEKRGQFGGRYREVIEPYQCDYLDMAEAALQAALGDGVVVPVDPTTEMVRRGEDALRKSGSGLSQLDGRKAADRIYRAMLQAAPSP